MEPHNQSIEKRHERAIKGLNSEITKNKRKLTVTLAIIIVCLVAIYAIQLWIKL
jgi:hypothetical protein